MRTGAALFSVLSLVACSGGTTAPTDGGADMCAAPGCPHDAGSVDGGADAAPSDGAPSDAGADAGGTDAGDDAGPTDAGSAIDAGASDAGGADLGAVDAGGSCGTSRPTITAITGTEGLVIARDGTVYYSQSRRVGRLLPDGTHDSAWAALPAAASTVWGIALDDANTHLYVGSPSSHAIYDVDATGATPVVTPLVTAVGQPNGLTMGPDGAVYYSDFGGGQVHRVDVTSLTNTTVTTSTISQANGVLFAPGDATTLYVLSYGAGTLLRLTLDATHRETARATVAMALGNPDGVTLDSTGRFYVTDNGGGAVIRLNADGTSPSMLMGGLSAPANLEFGVGVLGCHDLYIATGGALARIDTATATSAALSWH